MLFKSTSSQTRKPRRQRLLVLATIALLGACSDSGSDPSADDDQDAAEQPEDSGNGSGTEPVTEPVAISVEQSLNALTLGATQEILVELDAQVAQVINESSNNGTSVESGTEAVAIQQCVTEETTRQLPQTTHNCPLGGVVSVVDGQTGLADGSCTVDVRAIRYRFDNCMLSSGADVVTLQGAITRESENFSASRFGVTSYRVNWENFILTEESGERSEITAQLQTDEQSGSGANSSSCSATTSNYSVFDDDQLVFSVSNARYEHETTFGPLNGPMDQSWTFSGQVGVGAAAVTIETSAAIEGTHNPSEADDTEYSGNLSIASTGDAQTTLAAFGVPGESLPRFTVTEFSSAQTEAVPMERSFDEVFGACPENAIPAAVIVQ